MSKEVAEEYASSLSDLTVNSKPLINMLTILAEENVDHAGVIVETVEKHLEKVAPEIKLPVLYLVDSIIKNVGGAYTQKFSQSIVNMFTRTFKQVDEKIRAQMFKLRETWHDVFPATKLYQMDVKVNLIDPAWPIQAQPHQGQSNIHPSATTSNNVAPSAPPPVEDDKIRSILAKKEQELLMLQRKKVEMELEQMRRQVEIAEKTVVKKVAVTGPTIADRSPNKSMVAPVVPVVNEVAVPAKQRLGPPVPKALGRIAPVSAALAGARRDPRLARHPPTAPPVTTAPPVAVVNPAPANDVFDIQPLDRVTKRNNVITIDVRPPRRSRHPRPPALPPLLPSVANLPPIPKLPRKDRDIRSESAPSPKRKKETAKERRRRRDERNNKDIDRNNHSERIDKSKDIEKTVETRPITSPEKKSRRQKEPRLEVSEDAPVDKTSQEIPKGPIETKNPLENLKAPAESVKGPLETFKTRNYPKQRYMRRNRENSDSPESREPSNVPEVMENKDVDLRVLQPVDAKPAPVAQKRSSTETNEVKAKKNKIDKFDVLFGNEDVDLRQLPQVEESNPAIVNSPKSDKAQEEDDVPMTSPTGSPKRDWHEVKKKVDEKKTPSKLDLVRAKLAEATKGKDRLGRPLLFSKSPSIERERRRTLSSEDPERIEDQEDFDENKKSISIIMSQAKEHLTEGQLDKNQYNTLMYQVLQLNEKLKLKEAKQKESLENSKRKLKAHIQGENHKVPSPKSSPTERNNFGDIDERITPAVFLDTPPDSQVMLQDSDMRVLDGVEQPVLLPMPAMPMFGGFRPVWRGQPRPRIEEFPKRFRNPTPPFFRGKFDKRGARMPFENRMPAPLPTPVYGMYQGDSPLTTYERSESPPPLGALGFTIPPTDFRILEYIDQDPVKTIQIDGIPREIRFYGDTAVIMLDWDDPREIKFLPGCRRVTFDNKDSIVITFNEGYKQVEIDDQVFDIKFGAPTRELFINGRWYECFFGGQPLGVMIDGKPRLLHLEGPMPQVDIGKEKRTDLVAGKINLIVNATQMHPVYLDAKPQKILVNNQFITLRFVDSLRTVLINEQPFKVEFGDLPKPILCGSEKYFIRFSALPRHIKPGCTHIANMEGLGAPMILPVRKIENFEPNNQNNVMEIDQVPVERPVKTPSPEMNAESLGLDMLASVMPSSDLTPSSSEYSLAEPLFSKTNNIPGLDPINDTPAEPMNILGNINVTDLFAKLVATGIVNVPSAPEAKEEVEDVKMKQREGRNVIHRVDFMKPETLRVKQPGLVSRLYGGMQCSGCGARFPPEHTVRYSQHLDWHFRQNRRDRDSARRAHSRHWHYDLSDWVQYEEVEDLEEREKSWFETSGSSAAPPPASRPASPAPPSAAALAPAPHACALCGDVFLQFYNEDKEEWHLRNSVLHDGGHYHPLCLEDYKASLTKEEPPKEEVSDDVTIEKTEEPIELADDEVADQSGNESDIEVVEENQTEPLEIDEGDEDDVVFKAEPVEQVVVDDDIDTDDETSASRLERDEQAKIDFAAVKIKQEPIDPDDEPIITAEEESVQAPIENIHTTVESSIDGNVQLDAANSLANSLPLAAIRINISKSLPTTVVTQDVSEEVEQPPPPGEEPELEYKLKPDLEGVEFSRQPPVVKGNELSGLCSIM